MRVLAAALIACCTSSGAPDSSPGGAARLIGRWAVDEQSCDSAWLTYRDDGSWTTGYNRGRWRLSGDRLTLELTHLVEIWRGQARAVRHLCHDERIRWRGPDQFVSRWEDGTVHHLRRCGAPAPTRDCIGDCAAGTPFDEEGWAVRPPAASRSCGER